MAKYTAEDKLNAVLRYLYGHESYREIADSLHTDQMTISNWVKQIEHNGSEGFIKSYTNYSQQFKLDVLNFMNEKGMSSYDVAAIFNIPSPRLVREWRKKFENGGSDALLPKKKGRPSVKKETKKINSQTPEPVESSVEALQAKMAHLEMENAYLKKLNALVQMQEKLQTKSKRTTLSARV